MRKLCAGLMMSLDGVVEAPDQWSGPYFAAEMMETMSEGLAAADTILLGRRTYLEFAKTWPEQGEDNPMAAFMNNSPKYVATSTLDAVAWGDSRLIKGDVVEEVRRLKEQPGANIQIPGSPRLVGSLLDAGVLDELTLMIFPIVLGGGMRLGDQMDQPKGLSLADSVTYSTGVQGLRYVPAAR